MDVTCEHCGTEYEFDETLVSDRGTTVKCTQCGHLFRVFRAGSPLPDPQGQDWRIRRADGAVDSLASIRELRERIVAGELGAADEISTGGRPYKPLGAIAELETYFAAAREARAEAAAQASAQATVAAMPARPVRAKRTLIGFGLTPAPSGDTPDVHEAPTVVPTGAYPDEAPTVMTAEAFGDDEAPTGRIPERPSDATVGATPARRTAPAHASATPTLRGTDAIVDLPTSVPVVRPSAARDEQATVRERTPVVEIQARPALRISEDDVVPPRRRGYRGAAVGLGLILLLAIGGGVYALRHRIPAFAAAPEAANVEDLAPARQALALDDRAGYERAAAAFEGLGDSAYASVGASRAHAALAQMLRFEAHDLEASPAAAEADRERARALRGEMDAHAAKARALAERAVAADPEGAEAALCLADALRLSGNLTAAEQHLARARLRDDAEPAEVFRVAALLAAAREGGDLARALQQARLAVEESPTTVRHRVLLARALVAAGQDTEARTVLAEAPHDHAQLRAVGAILDARRATLQ